VLLLLLLLMLPQEDPYSFPSSLCRLRNPGVRQPKAPRPNRSAALAQM
jgi:hypothetical protein